jgi:hypothetical protein
MLEKEPEGIELWNQLTEKKIFWEKNIGKRFKKL